LGAGLTSFSLRDLAGKTVLQHRERLEKIMTPVDGIQVGRWVKNQGKDLFELAKEKGLKVSSPSAKQAFTGRGNALPIWLKIKVATAAGVRRLWVH
jgi:hypothetical protein